MGIHPIQGFKQLSTGKKAALVAAAGVATAAYVTGRKTDAFVKAAEAVKGNVLGAKKLNVLQTMAEGFKDFAQFIGYGISKFKVSLIKGAPTQKESLAIGQLAKRETFATGLTKRFIEKHGSSIAK